MSLNYDYISIEGYLVKIECTKSNHVMHSPKGLPWLHYCKKCGLVLLKNKVFRKAYETGCCHYQDRIVGKI